MSAGTDLLDLLCVSSCVSFRKNDLPVGEDVKPRSRYCTIMLLHTLVQLGDCPLVTLQLRLYVYEDCTYT